MNTATYNTIIGKNIKTVREEMGLSQEFLAKYLDVTRAMISCYETGYCTVPTTQLSKLASLLCLDEFDFYAADALRQKIGQAFVSRVDLSREEDLQGLAQFTKVVHNYLNMKRVAARE